MPASYTFLPWVRQGVVSAITDKDTPDAQLKSRVQMSVAAHLNNNPNSDAKIMVRVYGPGDVTGFDARQVIRTEPQHLTTDFEPNYLPAIEFDRPDFPWLFTPAAANDYQQLRPWICLIVVEKREDNLKIDPSRPLPVLRAIAKDELPDLSESWAWAHVQVAGSLEADAFQKPERNLSRLLCPLRLEPNKSYYACVVPTFEAGRKAGLGEPVQDGSGEADEILKPAWENNTGEIELPIYYHWEFATSAAGDFESLVWLLQHRNLSSKEVGTREVQVENPDPGDPQATPPVPPYWPEIGKIPLEGALRAYQGQAQNQDDPLKPLQDNEDYKEFQEKLRLLLNKPEDPQSSATLPPGLPIAPPIYGHWHAAQRTIPDGTRDVTWLRDLNLNPSHRAVASIGTYIVQEQQEQLMGSAWDQLGEIEKANQILRQAQLAVAAGTVIYQQDLAALDEGTFFAVTGATHSRVLSGPPGSKTVSASTRDSRLPQAVAQGAFRRLIRPRGPLARRLVAYGGLNLARLVQRLNNGEINIVPQPVPPLGMVTMDEVFKASGRTQDRFCAVTSGFLEQVILVEFPPPNMVDSLNQILAGLDQLLGSSPPDDVRNHLVQARQNLVQCRESLLTSPISLKYLHMALDSFSAARTELIDAMGSTADPSLYDAIDQLRFALDRIISPQQTQRLLFGIVAAEHQQDMEPCDRPGPQLKPRLDLIAIKNTILDQLNPGTTIKARIKSRIIAPPNWNLDQRFEPIMAAPEFPTPMYKPLAALSQDLILPGLERVPPNTITLLEDNPRFIEAYMIGLNHEMSRELLWREFPTDQRGTYFRQFWDPRGKVPQPTTPTEREAAKDIRPVTDATVWKDANRLGDNMRGGGGKGQIVLLIRGDLLRRYPRATIYAAEAKWSTAQQGKRNPTTNERYPIFQGQLSPDITFLGFDLDPAIAVGSSSPAEGKPGWFFVLQQQPTEPRFGLDETPPGERRGTWRDLSWQDVKLTDNYPYIRLADGLKNTFPIPTTSPNVIWGSNSNGAALAFITLQAPFRAAIHASDLLS